MPLAVGSGPWDTDERRRPPEVESRLEGLSRSGSVLLSRPTINYEGWSKGNPVGQKKKRAANATPYLDAITVRSDHHGREVDLSASTHGNLLVQPTLVPDLFHTGVDVKVRPENAHSAGNRYFYPDGCKSATMRANIQAKLREKLPTESELRSTYTRGSLKLSSAFMNKINNAPPPIETFYQKMERELREKRRKVRKELLLAGQDPEKATPQAMRRMSKHYCHFENRPGTAATTSSIQVRIRNDEDSLEMIRVMRMTGARMEMAMGQNRRTTDSKRHMDHENHGAYNHNDHSAAEEAWEYVHRHEKHLGVKDRDCD